LLLFFNHSLDGSLIVTLSEIFFISSFSSFLAMNFTGASTYTSLAGVKKEMRVAVPVQVTFAALAVILLVLDIAI
jgi:hypothetical protein